MEGEDGRTDEEIEMKERREQEAAEREDEEETAFDDRRRDESILIPDGSNPDFTRVDTGGSDRTAAGGSIDATRGRLIDIKKRFLKDTFKVIIHKGDGLNSRILYDKMDITLNSNDEFGGAIYRGSKILIMRDGKIEYSVSNRLQPKVKEFKELLERAKGEHQNTVAALLERHVDVDDVDQETVNSVVDNVSDRIESEIDEAMDDITTNTEITENELRELRGLLNPKGRTVADKLKALKIESKNWKDKAREEGDTRKGKLYESIAKIADLKADELRLRLNQKPVSEEVTSMVEEEADVNDLTRFKRFKKWSKKNLVNLSTLAISVAGIITTIVMAGRNALKKGGDALRKYGKAVANVIKKVWPVLAPLGTLILKIFEFLGKGLLFLANNLWLLALALTYFIYSEYNIRRRPGK